MFLNILVADLCIQLDISFVLGHALYMKAIHGVKARDDKIESERFASPHVGFVGYSRKLKPWNQRMNSSVFTQLISLNRIVWHMIPKFLRQ